MHEELIDICRADGTPDGRRKAKSAVHRDGDWHRAVHVWITTPEGRILLQRRAAVKENYPGLWDVSVAGHISAGESAREAALREAKEEVGIELRDDRMDHLATIPEAVTLNDGTYIDREFNEVYVVRRAVDVATLVLQPEEVDDAKLVPFAELEWMIASGDRALVPHPREYEKLLEYLKGSGLGAQCSET